MGIFDEFSQETNTAFELIRDTLEKNNINQIVACAAMVQVFEIIFQHVANKHGVTKAQSVIETAIETLKMIIEHESRQHNKHLH